MSDFEKLKMKLEEKRKSITTVEDREKVDLVSKLFSDEKCFFNIDVNTAIGILEFLEVPIDEMMQTYKSLISPENYQRVFPKERFVVEGGNVNKK